MNEPEPPLPLNPAEDPSRPDQPPPPEAPPLTAAATDTPLVAESAPPVPPDSAAGTTEPPLLTAEPPASVPASAPVPSVPPPPAVHGFQFHGRSDEYFRIWIVNTLLTLVTAGLFFPWAKVRKRRYLRGCTEVLGHRFDYRASPVRLLFGHLLIAAFFLGYSVFGVVYPVVRYGVLLLGVVLLPWIVARSLAFNAHNTAYRGLRFRFQASLSSATSVFLFEPLLFLVTLGFYYPAWARSKRRYIVSNHRLGDAYFHFDGRAGPFYLAYLISGAVVIVALVAGAMAVGGYVALHPGRTPPFWVTGVFLVFYGFGLFVARHLIHAQLFNHIWTHTRLDEHRFVATMDTSRWLVLQLANLGAIVGTLGLLYPWAVMRAHRYTASCLGVVLAGPIESIRRLEAGGGSATGDTAAEFVGLDFGI